MQRRPYRREAQGPQVPRTQHMQQLSAHHDEVTILEFVTLGVDREMRLRVDDGLTCVIADFLHAIADSVAHANQRIDRRFGLGLGLKHIRAPQVQ
jgi:hypothetical protein